MDSKTAARIVFALTFVGIGVIGVASGTFAPNWQPVPPGTPARELLAWLCTLVALGCGAGLLAKRTATPAALALTAYLILWTAVFKAPFIVRAPLEEVSYQSNGENWVLIAAAWLLYAESAANRGWLASDRGVRIAYLLYGLALIAFGLSHFFYLDMTTPLVPARLPGPSLFWAYATGAVYLACGILIAANLAARWATLAAAAQIALITLLVWGPMLAAGGLSATHWQETVVSWALTAGAWVLASGSPPATGWLRRPSPRDR